MISAVKPTSLSWCFEVAQGIGSFGWTDFESEPGLLGDGSGDPGKYILTITDPEGEEFATIVHRTWDGKFPLHGEVAQEKRARAERIVSALNVY